MKSIRTICFIVVALMAWQINAAELTSAKLTMISPDGEIAFDMPQKGFEVADYTDMGAAPTLVVKSFEVNATGNVAGVTLCVAMYKQGKSAQDENWMEFPLTDAGNGKWSIVINQDLVEHVDEPGNYALEIYVKATDADNQSQLLLNNGGGNYIVKFALGESDDNGKVHWLKNRAAEIYLVADENYLQYRYNGDGTRDNETQPGSLDMFFINFFSLYYDLEEGVEITDASLQYKICPEGKDDAQWNTIECNEVNSLVSSRTNTYRSTFNEQRLISRGLEAGNYDLYIMFQLIDSEGKYYFLGKDNDNFVFHFSVNEPKDPDITGISMVITPTPGEQQYPWVQKDEPFDAIDLLEEGPIQSMTLDEVFIFAEGNFFNLKLAYKLIDESDFGNEVYRDDVYTNLDDFGNWSCEEPQEMLRSDLLEEGHEYSLVFWAEGIADGNFYYLNNNGDDNYYIKFVYGSSEGGDKGDLNGDGNVNSSDISALYTALLNGTEDTAYDVNGDGEINAGDVSTLYDFIINGQ